MQDKIKFDAHNYRKHNDRNKELINKSLKECGAGRSIVIDNDNEIIAGNGIYEQAQKLGLKTKVIETDGSELVVVKRTDLQTDDAKRKQLAVMDNSTSDSSEFDFELLQADFDTEELEDWGLDVAETVAEDEKVKEEKPELEFTEELLEEHNYIVLTFDNSADWMTCCDLLDVKTVKTPDSRKGYERAGVGRVFKGERFLRGLNGNND